jgi:hypothetical protein
LGWRGATNSVVAVLFAGPLCGCAFSDVELEPVTAFEHVRQIGRGREVVVQKFIDVRDEQDRCGMKKNGYNADTANVICPEPDVGNWIAWMFASRLKSAGFSVIAPGQQHSPDPLFVEGRVEQFFVEPVLYFFTANIETDLGVQVVARTGSGMTAARVFYVKGTDSAFWGTDGAFQTSFENATQSMLTSMVEAVADLMNRHPGLGAPRRRGAGDVGFAERTEQIAFGLMRESAP